MDLSWLAQNFPDLSGIAFLSKGGQKLVCSATHFSEGDVVLKIILPNSDPDRVKREVLAVATVPHARIPKILGSGLLPSQFGNCFWFREQRISGDCLRQVVVAGAMKAPEVVRLGVEILEILVECERTKIVHRDIKPDNIIRDQQGNFWLIDFGLARHLELESLTLTGQPGVGTFGYSPPEQMRNLKPMIDGRSDLFALGVTLHEAATSINPFIHGTNRFDAAERVRRVESMPLPKLYAGESEPWKENFSDFVECLTQKRRDHRPRTIEDAHRWATEIHADSGA